MVNRIRPPTDVDLSSLVTLLAEKLEAMQWKMSAAESCTGGWIAKCCTDRPGSSAWFERGYVTYSNEAKQALLGVGANTLAAEGAVSEAVARQMVEGARSGAGVEAAIAVTGVAGPDGGTEEKPVGTVWFGWALGCSTTDTECACFPGDREAIRRHTVAYALQGLIDRL